MVKNFLIFGLVLNFVKNQSSQEPIMITPTVSQHTTFTVLEDKLKVAAELVKVGALYFHYRNSQSHYQVIALALQEATEEVCVVYKSLDNGAIWVRNLNVWLDEVEYNGAKIARFQLVQE